MTHDPHWRLEIDMSKEEDFCPPRQRCMVLRRFKELFEREVRRSFRDAANDPDIATDRSPVWTPIPGLCHNLEISHIHLSRMLRELTGLNAIQTYDKMKIANLEIPLKYIELIQQYLHSLAPNPSSPLPYSGNGAKQFWRWLKQQRNNPDFDRQALAREFNFPSAARFHRAFNFATDHTPREFENLIIRLSIDDPNELKNLIAKCTPKESSLAPIPSSLAPNSSHDEQLFSQASTAQPDEANKAPNDQEPFPAAPIPTSQQEPTPKPGEPLDLAPSLNAIASPTVVQTVVEECPPIPTESTHSVPCS